MVFQYMAGAAGFKTKEEQQEFINSFERAFSGNNRFRAMLMPKGIEAGDPINIENDKAQFLETRKLQREIIAGAFGVPPHMVGSLANSTYNNVEQQSLDFVINVILPHVRRFEAALEDALLTPEDRSGGNIIRFNLDAALRGDFKSRQEGLKIMREWGVINVNDWREMENMNPVSDDDGGEDFLRPLNMGVPGEEPPANNKPNGNEGSSNAPKT
jgi:HK97 family phage portal protein